MFFVCLDVTMLKYGIYSHVKYRLDGAVWKVLQYLFTSF